MTTRARPVRTCVGCRARAASSDLLRIVAVAGAPPRVVPDPRGGQPGRGAHLHPTVDCLALAERRHGFGRGLRLTGPVDAEAVRAWVENRPPGPERADDDDERSMSSHR